MQYCNLCYVTHARERITGKSIPMMEIVAHVQERRKPKRVGDPKNPKEDEENMPQKARMIRLIRTVQKQSKQF